MSHPTQMKSSDTALLVIDMQAKLVPKIHQAGEITRNIAFLIDGARLLDVPVSATEQYPKGLGPTIEELARRLPDRPDKTDFSCAAVASVVDGFRRGARTKIVLAGIESHVCVMHTALDLLAQDFRVYIPVDAVSSRSRIDHETALKRLEKIGVTLTTAETCVFEWLGGSKHRRFKEASRLVQERDKVRDESA